MAEPVRVYFDFLCQYSWRAAELAHTVTEGSDVRFAWHHFSVYQRNHDSGRNGATEAGRGAGNGWQLWNESIDEADRDGVKGLLPFLASHAARRQGDRAHDAFRLALLRARHRDREPLDGATVRRIAEDVGLHMPRFEESLANPELRTLLAHDQHRADRVDITATPTFVFPDGHVVTIRLRDLPAEEHDRLELFEHVRRTLDRYPYLESLQRPRPRNN